MAGVQVQMLIVRTQAGSFPKMHQAPILPYRQEMVTTLLQMMMPVIVMVQMICFLLGPLNYLMRT